MIAAADLENAAFQRDRLALVCGEAIRRALSTGLTHREVAEAASLLEAEVRRRTTLPIIDMQNACFEDEILGGSKASLVAACKTLIEAAARGGSPVLVARTEHLRDRST